MRRGFFFPKRVSHAQQELPETRAMTKKPRQGSVGLNRVGSKNRDDAYQKRFVDRVSNWVTVLSLIFIFAAFFEAKQMEITIGGLRLILITTIVGVVLACLVCLSFVIRFPFIRQASLIIRLSLFFLASLGCSCMAMATASYLNRTFAERQTFSKQVRIEHKASSSMGRYRSSRKIRLLYIVIDGGTERIEVKEDFWLSVSEGSTIRLELRRGFFGYAYVVGHEKTGESEGGRNGVTSLILLTLGLVGFKRLDAAG